jgi:hypothetical protein
MVVDSYLHLSQQRADMLVPISVTSQHLNLSIYLGAILDCHVNAVWRRSSLVMKVIPTSLTKRRRKQPFRICRTKVMAEACPLSKLPKLSV